MPTLNASKFLELLRMSGLVDNDQLTQAVSTAEAELGDGANDEHADSQRLAERLVGAGLITRWQRDKLLDGKYKPFFLKNYKLLDLLGTGGMSSVYLAEHVLMHRHVAIKVLPTNRVDDSSYLARFRREAQAAARLDHPNIVRVYDIDNDGKTHYLVMEYIQGRDLSELVKEAGPLEYETAADYVRQAALGLHHAHQAGLIHRDIKPANLLVDPKGVVKVLDMGLARFEDEKTPSLTIAHEENVLGTADYLAPEQAVNSHLADARADIYSLGCTLYYLLTGHPPFPEGTLAQRILAHQTKTPPSVFEDRKDAPQALVDLCLRMMAKQPDARFRTAGEVADALGKWLANRYQLAASDSGIRRAPPRRPPGGGSSVVRRARPATDDDTVSDVDRGTIKGSPAPRRVPTGESSIKGRAAGASDSRSGSGIRAGDSGRSRALPKAQALEEPIAAKPKGGPLFDPEADLVASGPQPTLAEERRAAKQHAPAMDLPVWVWYALGGAVGFAVLLALLIWLFN